MYVYVPFGEMLFMSFAHFLVKFFLPAEFLDFLIYIVDKIPLDT